MEIVALGGGESGVGAALLAKAKGLDVFLSDGGNIKPEYKDVLEHHEIAYEEGQHSFEKLKECSLVIKSPGIPEEADIVQNLRQIGAEVISEIEFAARYFSGNIIGITGSNGKTTTTLLTHHLAKKAGLNPMIAGNIGDSFAKQVIHSNEGIAVLELSSFQLDGIVQLKPHIAMILNITPDHLDRYGGIMERYVAAKFRITMNQSADDYLIYNIDDPVITSYLKNNKTKAQLLPISIKKKLEKGAWIEENEIKILINKTGINMTIQKLALQGKHNLYNSMAAGVAGRILELRKEIIRESLSDFQNVEHRLEHVTKVCGVNYINDSKATNINSTWYALESMDAPTVWIVGGVDKGNDYEMLKELVADKVKAIICLGLDNQKIHEAFDGMIETVVDAQSMRDAVQYAYKLSDKGENVLLSPACASFDLFENYEERGHQFKEHVRSL